MIDSKRHSKRLLVRLRLCVIGLHLLFGGFQVAVLFPFADIPARRRLRQAWSHQLLGLLGIRVEHDPGELGALDAGLLVSNHVSFVDILAINAVLPSGFVAKSDVAGWPLIGWLAARNETVFIERGNRQAAHRTRENMVAALGGGGRLAIFPEGTTTRGDRVLPFHAALLQSAVDAGAPVHALVVAYSDRDGRSSQAAAYVDDLSLVECLETILASPGLVARVALAASFPPPQADRRSLAHGAHQAVAHGLARLSCAISP